ncbi:arabinosyltransferase XEG113-like isoform X2 [Phragmites australis]|uniref:arabinosyltransferase XEG113-like isoform X2 n=1 Tax=Phragmites australis TaxID=29695 RepID=UPI002D78A368|nr:arabinosyltransferase XEG113-like isoform X2 [Phragmites australis]
MAAWCPAESTKPVFVGIYGAVLGSFAVSALFFLFSSFSLSALPLPLPTAATTTTNLSAAPAQPETMYNRAIWKPPPRGARMPPPPAFRLSRDMVRARARDGVIVVTFGNHAFLDFILTWARRLTDLGVDNLLVGAMDTKLLRELYLRGVPAFDMGSRMATEDAGWGSPTFHKMGREKVLLINALLPFGYELLMCDTDMVWLKNPLPYLARYPDADLLTSSDQVIPTVTDDSLENWREVTGAFNIGIFHWRPTEPAKRLAQDWKDLVLSDDKLWDQNAFNDLAHRVFGQSVEGEDDLVYSYDGKLKLGVLPASIFCNGHTYFVQGMHQQLHLKPYAVHTTFQYAGTEGKRHRLREAMLFVDQLSYYDSPGGFLSFKPNIPKSLLLDGAHTVESHFALVNYQVMPPLWCRLDRMWFGHPGVMEGTMTRQPFLCPMDHVFEVQVMLKDLPKEEFGPYIDFREYSFFENPSFPKQAKESLLEVQLCDDHSSRCSAANGTNKHRPLLLPRNSTEQKLLNVFSSYKNVKIIQFSSMVDVFRGFADAATQTKFRNRLKRYVGLWCCVQFREIGHIYYDMYWDEKPGWKPQPPETREDDHPPLS